MNDFFSVLKQNQTLFNQNSFKKIKDVTDFNFYTLKSLSTSMIVIYLNKVSKLFDLLNGFKTYFVVKKLILCCKDNYSVVFNFR